MQRRLGWGLLATLLLAGCSSPEAAFKLNVVYIERQQSDASSLVTPAHRQELAAALEALFGTPDDPHLPPLDGVDQMLDLDNLRLAAGPVASDRHGRPQGLYREHCVHCHGVTGDGMGPTAAFLNPYPRDFRPGMYKFTSTPIGAKPTRDDLRRTLREGIPGTAMPSFRMLTSVEIEALIDYVKYLSIRGEFERRLVEEMAFEFDSDDRLLDPHSDEFPGQVRLLSAIAQDVVAVWGDAEQAVTEVRSPPENWETEESIAQGREKFFVAGCASCHGPLALGDGQVTDYDAWAEEIRPAHEDLRRYLALGALPPRHAIPRNLRQGVYRGGRRPVDLYWRVRNGIEGTPMPGLEILAPGAPEGVEGLTEEDVWHLIAYVRNLPYEPISQPAHHKPELERDRL